MEEKTREERLEEYKHLEQTYYELFNSRSGQIVLEDLKKECFFLQTTYNEKESLFYLKEGMRNALLMILAKIEKGKNPQHS